jgi:hypothetical protein
VEVKIGVRDVPGAVVLESELSPTEVAAAVETAVAKGSLLTLSDERGRLVMIPGNLIGYVEIGAPESRRVGFGSI